MPQGDFVWTELCTPDPAAAAAFYAKVVGWTVKPSGLPGIDYSLICVGEQGVGGILRLPPEQMPPRPAWFGYIAVEDVDAKAAEIAAAGGAVHKPPADIPMVGRFAVVTDTQGAAFMIFKRLPGEPPPPLPPMTPGTTGWHELHAKDAGAAWSFYETMFGWRKEAAFDMGPLGQYQIFRTGAMPCGGMETDPNAMPGPYWLYYFAVDDIDAALNLVEENGGKLLFGPQEVPGGAFIIRAHDPQGGLFALVGMRKKSEETT